MGYIVMILFVTLVVAALPTEAEFEIYEDTVRLHILADSNEEVAQELKLDIRDKVLAKYGSILASAGNADEAEAMARSLEGEIKADVDEWIREAGFNYTSSCVIGKERYETRYYDGFALPSGEYTSVRIMLGSGEGKNWWCVMYPPLCLDMSTERREGYTKAENDLIMGKYVIKFKIMELISEVIK